MLRRILIPGRIAETLRDSLWAFPGACIVAAAGLAIATLEVDRSHDTSFAYSGSAASARSVLSTLASAMLSFTGLVFSITIVALQLASSQWSPRVMRTFLRDRSSKLALGTFVGTLTYGFAVLRGVSDHFIPGLSLSAALALLLVSLAVFIHYIDHIAHALRVTSVIAAVGDEGRAAVARLLCGEDARPAPDLGTPSEVLAHEGPPGVVVAYDERELVRCATSAGTIIELAAAVGSAVPVGAPLLWLYGPGPEGRDLRELVEVARERTTQQDAAFALRQLVDIAIRALSPGLNDPTTAVQAFDRIHDLLRDIVRRPIPGGCSRDAEGRIRLVVPATSWDDYVALAFDEITHYGAGHPQVHTRLLDAIADLLAIAPPARVAALERRAASLAGRSWGG